MISKQLLHRVRNRLQVAVGRVDNAIAELEKSKAEMLNLSVMLGAQEKKTGDDRSTNGRSD